jgi:hypothetical protein
MRRHKTTTIFSLSIAVLFLATLVIQPHSQAQFTRDVLEGGGFTRDASKINAKEEVTFLQDQSFDKEDFESGTAAPEDTLEGGPVEATDPADARTSSVIIGNPSLPGGVDHAAAGTGTRNAGYGTIRLRGIPVGAVIVRAWLYWGAVLATPIPTTANVTFNGTTVTGKRLSVTTPEPCWLFPSARFAAFRANVRPLIAAGINADYRITGLASAITNGTDPFICAPPFTAPPMPAQEGATLLVIYSHKSIPASTRTWIHHGPVLVTGNTTINHGLSPVVPTHSVIKQTRFGGDGQIGCSLFGVALLNGENTLLGPNAFSLTQVKGPGSTINEDSDWSGHDGVSLNQLWDTHTDAFGSVNSVTGLIPAGSAGYVVQYTGVGDCFVTVAHVLTAR